MRLLQSSSHDLLPDPASCVDVMFALILFNVLSQSHVINGIKFIFCSNVFYWILTADGAAPNVCVQTSRQVTLYFSFAILVELVNALD